MEVGILERRLTRKINSSYMANSGANVAIIQSALNHKDLRTTLKVYTKVADRSELEARAMSKAAVNKVEVKELAIAI